MITDKDGITYGPLTPKQDVAGFFRKAELAATEAAREAADLCGRAQLRILESTRDNDRDRRERWHAAHILFMTAVGLANHPRSFAGITFDARGIAEWRQP